MQPGDLVRHRADGALGICTSVDKQLSECRVAWFDCGSFQTPYRFEDFATVIEVVSESR